MFVFTSLLTTSLVSALTLSPSLSHYGVATSTLELTNPAQPQDPFHPGQERRRLMLSAFYPAGEKEQCEPIAFPYMPPKTAAAYDAMYASLGVPKNSFASVEMALCKPSEEQGAEYPLVLFSPGMGDSRLVYNFIAASLASEGYVVVTIDHPYDAPIIEYPDHSTVLAFNISTKGQILTDLTARVNDVIFVVDSLQDLSQRQRLFGDAARPLPVQMFGHSFGGATAGQAMVQDNRITGGLNLDGTMFGSVVKRGLSCPFMFVSHEGKNLTTDSSWLKTWRHLTSTKVEVTAKNSQHGTFTDFPFVAQNLGLTYNSTSPLAGLLGTIPGNETLPMLAALVDGFFQYALGSSDTPVSKNTLTSFPELEVLKTVLSRRCN
jgi:dienelactone hydrolase